jgi:cytochrome c-type biogenesis protein CcmH/NrfF
MTLEWLHPGLLLILGAWVLPFLPRRLKQVAGPTAPPRTQRPARPHAPTAEESAAHEALVDSMKDPVWRQ